MDKETSGSREEKDMSKTLDKQAQKKAEDFSKRNFDRLHAHAERIPCDDEGVILLDRNNPLHTEWFESED